jgi:hypothetical protein
MDKTYNYSTAMYILFRSSNLDCHKERIRLRGQLRMVNMPCYNDKVIKDWRPFTVGMTSSVSFSIN